MNFLQKIIPILRLNGEWNDYYSDSDIYHKVKSPNQLFSKQNGKNYYITLSTFSNLKNRAVYISYPELPLLLFESATINDCSSSDDDEGGSIFFNGNSFVFSKCCMLKSNMFGSNPEGTAAYIQCKNSELSKNYFLFSNVFQNAEQTNNAKVTLFLQKGNIFLNYVNFTNNRCKASGNFNFDSSKIWINYTMFVENTDDGNSNILQNSGNFFGFILSENHCTLSQTQTTLFKILNSDSLIDQCFIRDYYHTVTFHTYGSCTFQSSYSCCNNIYAENSMSMDGANFNCQPTLPPGVEIPDINKCNFYNNNDNTCDDRNMKSHVGLVALLGYNALS